MMPIRVQRERKKGWRMPPNTVYVGRGSEWGNPHMVIGEITPKIAVEKYAATMMPYKHIGPNSSMDDFYLSIAFIEAVQYALAGKNLACWCPLDQPCHADFLMEIANDKRLSSR